MHEDSIEEMPTIKDPQVLKLLDTIGEFPSNKVIMLAGKDIVEVGPIRIEGTDSLYKGQMRNNLRHGVGIQIFKDGSQYQG